MERVVWFEDVGMGDVERVGGKNASLGEMISGLSASGVRVPGGFATTADAFREMLGANGLDKQIESALAGLDTDNVKALRETGARVRGLIMGADLPPRLEREVREAYAKLCGDDAELSVAVRSSATAEDLPEASFAGQQETFLNVRASMRCWVA